MTSRKVNAVLLLGAGLLAAAVFAAVAFDVGGLPRPVNTMTLLVGLAAVAVITSSIGVNILLDLKHEGAGEARPPADYSHTYRLFGLLGFIIAAALGAQQLLIPKSFGQFGFYRGEAVAAARAIPTKYAGKAACNECHDDKVRLHDKDVHATVECEDCHGPGAMHIADPEKVKPPKPKGKEACLVCHRQMPSRPGPFPQVKREEHYAFVGVKDPNVDCTQCHDPHEPLYMDRDLRTARLHPVIHRCRDCHTAAVNEAQPRPAGHPAIFECGYCHAAVKKDFAGRTHKKQACTTCHIYVAESESAGRIIRDADPRFCLLCHRAAPFRSDSAAPGITWPAHLDDVGAGPADREKRCIDCHRDRIHGLHKDITHER